MSVDDAKFVTYALRTQCRSREKLYKWQQQWKTTKNCFYLCAANSIRAANTLTRTHTRTHTYGKVINNSVSDWCILNRTGNLLMYHRMMNVYVCSRQGQNKTQKKVSAHKTKRHDARYTCYAYIRFHTYFTYEKMNWNPTFAEHKQNENYKIFPLWDGDWALSRFSSKTMIMSFSACKNLAYNICM